MEQMTRIELNWIKKSTWATAMYGANQQNNQAAAMHSANWWNRIKRAHAGYFIEKSHSVRYSRVEVVYYVGNSWSIF